MSLAKDIQIRKVTDDDLDEVFPMIDNENWYWTLSEVEQLLKMDKAHSLVAMRNNEIAGILFVLKNGSFATWTHFIVKDKFRSEGIGTKLINYNFDDLDKAGVSDIDIIAVFEKVGFYKNFNFNKTEEILFYESNSAAFKEKRSASVSKNCKTVNMKELQKAGDIKRLEENSGCRLNKLTGGLVYDGVSPVVGYYEDNLLKGIMLTHVVSNFIDYGPWIIEDITIEKAKEMLLFAAGLEEDKSISICFSSENKIAKELVESEGFRFEEKLARMVRSDKETNALKENILAIGKF